MIESANLTHLLATQQRNPLKESIMMMICPTRTPRSGPEVKTTISKVKAA
jgi:hypothetical protein